jgi:hypothetical protein
MLLRGSFMDKRPFFGKICKSGVPLSQKGTDKFLWQIV